MGAVQLNYLQKSEITGTITNLTDSQVFDNGTEVGINTNLPNERLEVFNGAIRVGMSASQDAILILANADREYQVKSAGGSLIIRDNTAGADRVTLLANGNFTIALNLELNGTITGATDITATGNVTCVDCLATSDERLKEDIKPFKAPIEKLRKLGSLLKSYRWKDSQNDDIGLLAQDVKNIFPELVKTDSNGYLSVNYQKLNLMMLQWI